MALSAPSKDRVVVVKASDSGPDLPILESGGTARALVWPGMGARERTMHLLTLAPSDRTIPLSHVSECVYHVSEGGGVMEDLGSDDRHEVVTGSMLFIEPNTEYRFIAGPSGAVLLGGPCPPDNEMYEELKGNDSKPGG